MLLLLPFIVGGALWWTELDAAPAAAPPAPEDPPKAPASPAPETALTLVQRFANSIIDPLMGDVHGQHLRTMSLDEYRVSAEQQEANSQFSFATMLLGSVSVCAVVSPPLVLLHIPPLVYLWGPFYKRAFRTLFVEHRVTTGVVDAVLGISSLSYATINPPILVIGAASGWLYALTNKIVTRTRSHTRASLTDLFGDRPEHVWVRRDGVEVQIHFESVQLGDVVVISAGQMIPVDGTIREGVASIDQHVLTGEAQPVEKGEGDPVFAATVVLAGTICVQVEKTGLDTVATQIGKALNQTADFISSVQLRGQEISDKAALPTLAAAAVALPLVGPSNAMAILFSGVGYNMRILGPLSVLSFLQRAARQGILIKDGRALEQLSKVDTIVFDKTGTLTLEQPHVGAIYACDGYSEDLVLLLAAAAERRQTHPIARAILQEARERELDLPAISDAAYEVGYGIRVVVDNTLVRVGSHRFMAIDGIYVPRSLDALEAAAHDQGHSLVYVAVDNQLAGSIELRPTIRPEVKRIVDGLRERELDLYIISGDHAGPTRRLAAQLGVQHYFAEVLPENKASAIARLQAEGRFVCFIGDGINDAIALKQANVSISLRGASSIATDTAQIILMDETLGHLGALFDISRQFEANMNRNFQTTLVPGAIIIGGAFLGVVGYGASVGLFFAGLAMGLVNAMSPLFEEQRTVAVPGSAAVEPPMRPVEPANPAERFHQPTDAPLDALTSTAI